MGVKIVFTTIGYIEWRKGQDILVEAIRRIPQETSCKCEFLLVGQDSSTMAQEIRNLSENMPYIKILGTVDRQEIDQILRQTDVLICPSREDPMPTVCAEAMLHSVPCLVSDATGTAAYITDGVNGLIFASENIDQLILKILWCINNKKELKEMGRNARLIYESEFSIQSFEKKLLGYVHGMLGDDGGRAEK